MGAEREPVASEFYNGSHLGVQLHFLFQDITGFSKSLSLQSISNRKQGNIPFFVLSKQRGGP